MVHWPQFNNIWSLNTKTNAQNVRFWRDLFNKVQISVTTFIKETLILLSYNQCFPSFAHWDVSVTSALQYASYLVTKKTIHIIQDKRGQKMHLFDYFCHCYLYHCFSLSPFLSYIVLSLYLFVFILVDLLCLPVSHTYHES